MKVKITVMSENLRRGEARLTNTAFFTYVALDDDGRPVLCAPESSDKGGISRFDREQRAYESMEG
jgi:acyl-CoA hydrolase